MSLTTRANGPETATQEVEGSMIKEIQNDTYDNTRNSSDPVVVAEKGDIVDVTGQEDNDEYEPLILSHEEQFPIDPNAEPELQQFTFRAVFVGCCLGGVIAASKCAEVVRNAPFHTN